METVKKDHPNEEDSSPIIDGSVSKIRTLYLALPSLLTWEALAWLVLAITAVFTRFWNLGLRVMSHDESLHAYFSWTLAKGSGYAHNPMMHGPLLFEATALLNTIFGTNDFTSRILPAILGIFIVIGIPLLLRRWLGRLGAFAASLLLLVSPYILYYSRYNRHDIEEIAWALLAVCAIFAYLHEREIADRQETVASDRWLLVLAGAVALMFSSMETAFFYLAIFASFLLLRLLAVNGFHWAQIRRSADFDLLVVMATLGAFFSSPIGLLVLNPIWTKLTGQPFVPVSVFNTYSVEWATGTSGIRIWGLMGFFWLAATIVGLWWGRTRWLKLASLFLVITLLLFTTFLTNKNGVGTGFVGSLGYWLSQQQVARGSQPWYYYLIVFPLYEYLPLIGGFAALVYFAIRQRFLPQRTQIFVLMLAWWAFWILFGLSSAGEKMPWLSTHITVPFILLSAWFIGQLLQPGWEWQEEEGGTQSLAVSMRSGRMLAVLPFVILFGLTVHTSYFVNYVNYDYTTEFVGYAHGAPGVKWLMADVNLISTQLGQGNAMPVAYDSANSWPLAWYLRDHPGFYGDQPNKAALDNAPVVVAGSANWDKVDKMLGANYDRYEVNRIWWPMEDYKNLSWDRIRGALTDPKMRSAVWDIIWSRNYAPYAALTKETLNPPGQWPLQDRMRIYIRKDVAAQVPNLKLQSSKLADLPVQQDIYASKRIEVSPLRTIQPGDLNAPRNLAFASDGSIYVADSGNARIVHLDPQGKVIAAWGSRTPDKQVPPAPGTFNEPWGLAVDSSGNVYVADTWNHRIQKFDSSGKFLLQWGTGGAITDGPDRFWGPRGVAISPDGNIYITDTGNRRVAVFDPQGKFLFDFAKDGQAQLNEPVGIAIDQTGRVLIVDTWNTRVAVFDLKGKFETSWPVQAWSSQSINDKPFIAVDAAGRVYLTEPEDSRVLVFSENGEPLAAFGELGPAETTFNLPTGIVFDPQGSIWIADAGNNRLDVYPTLKP